jgi:hypothetical protein
MMGGNIVKTLCLGLWLLASCLAGGMVRTAEAGVGDTLVEEFGVVDEKIYLALVKLSRLSGVPIFVEDMELERVFLPDGGGIRSTGVLESTRLTLHVRRQTLREILNTMRDTAPRFYIIENLDCINVVSLDIPTDSNPMEKRFRDFEFEGGVEDMVSFMASYYDFKSGLVDPLRFLKDIKVTIIIKGDMPIRHFVNELCLSSGARWATLLYKERDAWEYTIESPDGTRTTGTARSIGELSVFRR